MTQNIPPSSALPALDDLIRPWPVHAWLEMLYQRLARHHSLYHRYAAIGLIQNRFLPEGREYLEAFIDQDGASGISHRVHVWTCAQEPRTMKIVTRLAEQELLEITAGLDQLAKTNWLEQELVTLAIRRELLEAVKMALLCGSAPLRLIDGLRTMDAWADQNIPFDRLKRHIPSELLTLVRETGSQQWWGKLTSD